MNLKRKHLPFYLLLTCVIGYISFTESCAKKGNANYMATPKEIEKSFDRVVEPKIAVIDPENENGDHKTNIISVPRKNVVGTFDLNQSFSLIRFEQDGTKIEQIMKYNPNSFPYDPHNVFGLYPINQDEVYFKGNNLMFLFSISKKDNLGYSAMGYSETYEFVTVYDKSNYSFLCKIGGGNIKLRLIELKHPPAYSNGKVNDGFGAYNVLAEKEFPPEQTVIGGTDFWIQKKNIFVFDTRSIQMLSFNDSLKPVQHPLAILINDKKLNIFEFAIHPELPFAVAMNSIDDPITGKSIYSYFLIRWQHAEEKERVTPFQIPIMKNIGPDIAKLFLFDYQFSPDGKWLLIKDGTKNFDNPDLFIYPVDDKNPLFLGEPYYLGHAFRDGAKQQSSCWIAEPCSYVVSDGMCLYKWEMPAAK